MNMVVVDDLRLEIRVSPRRKSLQLTVERDGSLIAFVPAGCRGRDIEDFVREKQAWIYKSLAAQEGHRQPITRKQYVSGEGFPYLGRSHRLLLVDEQSVPVKLDEGRFKMRRSEARQGHAQMVAWYTAHAQPWVARLMERFSTRVGLIPADIVVRELGYRWGSCGKGSRVNFHWKTILLPPRMVEYVVLHELVHLIEPHHTPDFWLRVERAMPDFAARKEWLAENGQQITAGL
ncbi:MAG TPA: SprT family zinc-dependent metalloprotease [Chloroflexota bacterium]